MNNRGDSLSVPESHVAYNGAQRGAMMSSDVAPTNEAARQMGRQAIEVFAVANKVANNGHGKRDEMMCEDVTSSENAAYIQHRPDENSPTRDGSFASHRRGDDKSDSEISEFSRRGIDELSRREINEQRRSIQKFTITGSAGDVSQCER